MKLLDKFIRSQLELTKNMGDGTTLESSRSLHSKVGKLMHFSRRKDVVVIDGYITEPECALMVPRDELRGGAIIYLHGGGYVCGDIDAAKGYAAVLCAECGMKVVCVEYRLAPENPYPAALDDALAAYKKVIELGTSPDRIILAGDSAGGGMAYALTLRLKAEGIALPAGIIAISPWCDLTLSGDSYKENRDKDPALTIDKLVFYTDCYVGQSYCSSNKGANSSKHSSVVRDPELEKLKVIPEVSPLFGDLSDMPPSLIFAGGDELLLSDAKALSEKLKASGCDVELVVRQEMWHDYVLYSLKRFKGDYDMMNSFIRRVLPRGNERKLKWMHIDNQGKIYPASRTSRWNNTYRLSMTLTEEVDREILQSALDVTVRRFPSIAVRLRRGVFWYYLQEIPHAPEVKDEFAYPLVRMPFDDIRHCAFRVVVYKNRIACEFFHALTDGNGALVFLKTLVAEYLEERYGIHIEPTDGVLDRLEEPKEEEYRDRFPDFKGPVSKSRQDTDSYRIHGTYEEDGFCHLTTFLLDPGELVDLAHENEVTVTTVLAAAMTMAAIRLQNEDKVNKRCQKEIKVLIPCDLRRIFGVDSMRNFMMYATPGIDPRLGEYTFAELASIIHKKVQLELTEKNLRAMISTNVKDEENMFNKIAPLFLKNIVMKFFFLLFGEKKSTLTLSNLGVIKLPETMRKYVSRVDFILGTQASGPYNAGVVSYNGTLNLSIIRNIKEPRLERELYRVLREIGVHVKVESNER